METRTVGAIDVLNALSRVIDTTKEHDDARDKFDGYSWDYHGAGYIIERDEARKDFMQRLDTYIDQRVEAKLNAAR